MKLFKVYVKKSETGKVNDLIVFKDGFSIMALIFNLAWLLYNRLWIKFLECFIFLAIASKVSNSHFGIFINVIVVLSIAFYGHDWYSEKLVEKEGYIFEGYEFVKNKDEALLKFVSNNKNFIRYSVKQYITKRNFLEKINLFRFLKFSPRSKIKIG